MSTGCHGRGTSPGHGAAHRRCGAARRYRADPAGRDRDRSSLRSPRSVSRSRWCSRPRPHVRRNRTSNRGMITQNLQWLILMGTSFTVAAYLQVVRGYDAIETGVIFTAATLGLLVSSLAAERLARHRDRRHHPGRRDHLDAPTRVRPGDGRSGPGRTGRFGHAAPRGARHRSLTRCRSNVDYQSGGVRRMSDRWRSPMDDCDAFDVGSRTDGAASLVIDARIARTERETWRHWYDPAQQPRGP